MNGLFPSVDHGLGTRYLAVPERDALAGHEDMEAFSATVSSEALQDGQLDAIWGRGAFRRFKDLMARHPDEEQRWYAFQAARLRARALDCLKGKGIEPFGGSAGSVRLGADQC